MKPKKYWVAIASIFIAIVTVATLITFIRNAEAQQLGLVQLDDGSQCLLVAYRDKTVIGGNAICLFYKRRADPWRWYYVEHESFTRIPWKISHDKARNAVVVTWYGKESCYIDLSTCVQMRKDRIHSSGNTIIEGHPLNVSYPIKKTRISDEVMR